MDHYDLLLAVVGAVTLAATALPLLACRAAALVPPDDSGRLLRQRLTRVSSRILCHFGTVTPETPVAMEKPSALDATSLRDRKVELLEAVRTPTPQEVATHTRRARYAAGRVGERQMPDYVREPGVDPDRQTETFAEVMLFIENDRWRGVPFRLRTGKALAADRREIAIRFLPVPDRVFEQQDDPPANRLLFQMGPDRMVLDLALNGAGDPFSLEPAALELTLAPQDLSAHARLLVETLEGDPALAIRADEAEECWRIVEPIVEQWERNVPPLLTYTAGSRGPSRPENDN